MLRFHKHINRFFISNPRNFLHSSSLPTAVTSELLNFPVTLLGDVRKEYLMPKICVAKCNPNSGTVKPVYVAVAGEEFLRRKLHVAPRLLLAPMTVLDTEQELYLQSHLSATLPGQRQSLGPPGHGAMDSVGTPIQSSLCSRLPFTRVLATALYSPGRPRVKMTDVKCAKSMP